MKYLGNPVVSTNPDREESPYYVSFMDIKNNIQSCYLLSTLEPHHEVFKYGQYLGYYKSKEEAQETIKKFKEKYPEEFV